MLNNDWKDISSDFTPELQKNWENKGFSYQQTRDWINIGLLPTEADFANWLSEEGYTAIAMLDFGDAEELRKEYQRNLTTPKPKSTIKPNILPWKLIVSLILLAIILLIFIR